jgi:hypothetical protein
MSFAIITWVASVISRASTEIINLTFHMCALAIIESFAAISL